MKTFLIFAFLLVVLPLSALAEPGDAYVGAGGSLMLPQGGARLGHRVVGAAAKFGVDLCDFYSVEADVGWLEDEVTIAAQGLVHFSYFDEYDKLFGYSRFDPFFTFGVRDWFGSCSQVGPKFGLGAFYYLSDNWALRGDFDAMLGLEGETDVDYTLSFGVQWFF